MKENGEFQKEIEEKLKNFNPDNFSVAELCKETGTEVTSINDSNRERFFPLLFAIEEMTVDGYKDNPSLRDWDVITSLKKIRNNIFSEAAGFNDLEKKIIDRIKIILLLNNYDKRDVSLSISCILKSAKLHRAVDGSVGYLNFISERFSQMEREEQHETI